MVYLQYNMTQTPLLANPLVRTIPPGTCFTSPLHGIMPGNGPAQCPRLQFWNFRGCHDRRDKSAAASIAQLLQSQLSNESPFIGIFSSVMVAGSDSIRILGSDLIRLPGTNLIRLPVPDLIRLTVFDWI